MFGALNGLGAAGEETASLSNVVNAVTFGALTVGGFFTGIICNKIGPRWTLALGTLGYAPYAAALYTNAAFGNKWFPILGGLTCGSSGVFLWTASGAINLVYPAVQQRGRAVATKFTLQNLASSVGGMISLGLNIKQAKAGRVSDATYYVFITIMTLGLPAAITIPQPHQVIRGDGSRVSAHRFKSWKDELAGLRQILKSKTFLIFCPFLIYWQWDLSYMWSWNAQYHSVRARALLSTLFYLIGPTFIGPVQGYLLDSTKWSRQSRARVAVVSFTIITLMTWIYGLVVQYQYNGRTEIIDIEDPVFIKSCLLFILYGLIENSAMVTGYWIIGSLGLDAGSVSTFVGLANAIGSAGSTAAFIIGACNVSLIWQLWANVIAFLVSVPGLLYTGFALIPEDAIIDAATTQVDWIDNADPNDAFNTSEKKQSHSFRESSAGESF
ncbi:hypothetical protein N7495_006969 [Penicillium taxi]|uniref:uncharacterized protein n=1 Tax=Penicillium taxi TaxID=168475 RepID=UPI002545152A|nr:uncharacterized protein N7495_006969 [Penicillium taxi]KAJ5895278.1 hypothetical protein N7495_006969 [Penicillium taxi]